MDIEALNKGNDLIKKIENIKSRVMNLETYYDKLIDDSNAKRITRVELHFWVKNEKNDGVRSESMAFNPVYASLLMDNITSLIISLREEIRQCEREFKEL